MRQSGILIHPSSIPHHGPCGDIGPDAIRFLDWLQESGISLWQTLPLHPPGAGFSPYSSHSAFAGAIYLCSLDLLVDQGLLTREETLPRPHSDRISVDAIQNWKIPLIYKAAQNLLNQSPQLVQDWVNTQHWAKDWGLYCALKKYYSVDGWQDFPISVRERDTEALNLVREKHQGEIMLELAAQYLFFSQWSRLKKAAADRSISIVGDMPIFVAADGCDTWTHRTLFRWDAQGHPDPLSGAPPDAFSDMGQHWGNPLYNWPEHQKENFAWWLRRIRSELELSDSLRIDHFRGFCAAWEIPRAAQGDARKGSWGASPGGALFSRLKEALPSLPFVAEDLGVITPDVDELREDFQLMGMKVLQFAFDSFEHTYLPHSYNHPGWACYTGTHDNDTVRGWYNSAPHTIQHRYRVYVGRDGSEPHWDLIRLAWSSTAQWAITTMQDVLGLDASGRMNIPGEGAGNWSWRAHDLPSDAASRLRFMSEVYARIPS